MTSTLADQVTPIAEALLGPDLPIRIEFWDGSATGPRASLI